MNEEARTPGAASGSDSEQVGVLQRLSDGREFVVGVGGLRVGRHRGADLALADRTVSRHHADLRYENGRYILYDHSSNGTWVNDSLVAVARPLRDGDRVTFGAVKFRFALKDVPRDKAAASGAGPDRVKESATVRMKGGKKWRRKGGGRAWRVALLALLLLVAGAVAAYFLAPEAADRLIGRLPAGLRELLVRD